MLNWDDIRAIDAIADPLGVLSVYADRPDNGNGRLVRAVSLAGELRRLEADMGATADTEVVTAHRPRVRRLRPALVRMLEGRAAGRALFAPLSSDEVFEVTVGLPVGLTAVVEKTAYVRPLVAAADEGRPAGVLVSDGSATRLLSWRMGTIEEVGEYRFPSRPGARVAQGLARDVQAVATDEAGPGSSSPETDGSRTSSRDRRPRPRSRSRWSRTRSPISALADLPRPSGPRCTTHSAGMSGRWSNGRSARASPATARCSAPEGRGGRSTSGW